MPKLQLYCPQSQISDVKNDEIVLNDQQEKRSTLKAIYPRGWKLDSKSDINQADFH